MLLVILSFLLGIFISNSTKNDLFEGFDCKTGGRTGLVDRIGDWTGPNCANVDGVRVTDFSNQKQTEASLHKFCDSYYNNKWGNPNNTCKANNYNTWLNGGQKQPCVQAQKCTD